MKLKLEPPYHFGYIYTDSDRDGNTHQEFDMESINYDVPIYKDRQCIAYIRKWDSPLTPPTYSYVGGSHPDKEV